MTSQPLPHPPTRSALKSAALTRRDFFDTVIDRLRDDLPVDRRGFQHRSNLMLLKIDFGNQRVHYEVWCDNERHILGLGLHFEDGPVSTAAYLAWFDARIVELKHTLGPEIELERWTASWGHLYEHWTLPPLTTSLASRVSRRLAELISILQPLVETAEIAPERSAQPSTTAGPYRKWRRGR